MKGVLIALIVSYLITWCSGLWVAGQRSIQPVRARRIHLGLSLIT